MIYYLMLFVGALTSTTLIGGERGSSAPYVSGDTFRLICDFLYDETSKELNPQEVKEGDILFVKTDYLEEFFEEVHPFIEERYILVTHNSDHPAPGPYEAFLDEERLIAWFGQNRENCTHPKLHPIPIGLANKCWEHGDPEIFKEVQESLQEQKSLQISERPYWLYMNFSVGTHYEERSRVAALFQDEPYCIVSEPKDLRSYLIDLTMSRFVLSPRGNGLDCHRTWEALLMGAYPIVKTSSLDPVYENLPVVIVSDWSEISETFLENKYNEFQTKDFNLERTYFEYWKERIISTSQLTVDN